MIMPEFLNMIKLPDSRCKSLRYLLVMPPIIEGDCQVYQFPTGLAYISSALKASGRDVLTLNLNYKDNYLELLRDIIVDNNVDVVAIGGLSIHYRVLCEVIDTAKSVKPDIVTIVGGGIITADPEVAIEALENADYGVYGEGEIIINALAYALETGEDASKVNGVVTKYGKLRSPPEIENLDCLPFPDYDGFEFDVLLNKASIYAGGGAYRATIAVSRSCLYNCTFCFHPSGVKYRRRSLDNVFNEIDRLIEQYGVETLDFCDELFIDKSDFVYKFCERIKRYNLKYRIQTRVDMVNKEIFKLLKESGCDIIGLGVESADNRILKSMRKFTTVEQIERAFDCAKEVGMTALGLIIFGDLEETPETVYNSLNWLKRHSNYSIDAFWILTFPGSYLYKVAYERGIIKDKVRYLKEGDFRINVSKMSDNTYNETVGDVELFKIMRPVGKEFCAETFSTNIKLVIERGKAAIWPTTTLILSIIYKYAPNILKSNNLWLVDTNRQPFSFRLSNMEKYTDKTVYSPDIISQEGIETIICITDNKFIEEIRDAVKKNYPSARHILQIADLIDGDILAGITAQTTVGNR
jgi:anaerobic magnesium-protoporphyrin IX monomethyl ester cyclase